MAARKIGRMGREKDQDTRTDTSARCTAGQSPSQPWEDKWGNPLPLDEIKKLSAKWNPIQWEEYLRSLEGNQKEKMGFKIDVKTRVELFEMRGDEEFEKNAEDDLAEAHAMEAEQTQYLKPVILKADDDAHNEFLEAETPDEKRATVVRTALQFLTVNERFVLERYFWDGRSEPKIARMMRKSRPTIQTWKKRALTKIYEMLSSVLPIIGEVPVSDLSLIEPKPKILGRPKKGRKPVLQDSRKPFSSGFPQDS